MGVLFYFFTLSLLVDAYCWMQWSLLISDEKLLGLAFVTLAM